MSGDVAPVIVSDIPGPTDAMRRMRQDKDLRLRLAANVCRFATERFEQTKLVEYIVKDRKRLLK